LLPQHIWTLSIPEVGRDERYTTGHRSDLRLCFWGVSLTISKLSPQESQRARPSEFQTAGEVSQPATGKAQPLLYSAAPERPRFVKVTLATARKSKSLFVAKHSAARDASQNFPQNGGPLGVRGDYLGSGIVTIYCLVPSMYTRAMRHF